MIGLRPMRSESQPKNRKNGTPMAGCLLAAVLYIPLFTMMAGAAGPAGYLSATPVMDTLINKGF